MPQWQQYSARLGQHPMWVVRWAFLCTMITIVIPMIVIVIAGMLVGICVFALLSLVAKVMDMLGMSDKPPVPTGEEEQLRRNVRVVEEDAM